MRGTPRVGWPRVRFRMSYRVAVAACGEGGKGCAAVVVRVWLFFFPHGEENLHSF